MAKRKIRLDEKQLKSVLKFLVKFNIFAIPLYFIIVTGWNFTWLQTLTADISYFLLSLLGYHPIMNNLLISIPIKNGNWAAFINWDCTGWKSILAFFALVMSTDFTTRKKLYGLLFIPVIYLVNILRIIFMFFYVRTFDLQYYNQVHSIVWGWGLIAVVLALWIFWMQKSRMDRCTCQLECKCGTKKQYISRKRK